MKRIKRVLSMTAVLFLVYTGPVATACDMPGCIVKPTDMGEILRLACDMPECEGDLKPEALEDLKRLACWDPGCGELIDGEIDRLRKLACSDPGCERAPTVDDLIRLAAGKAADRPEKYVMMGVRRTPETTGLEAKLEKRARAEIPERAVRLRNADREEFPILTRLLSRPVPVNTKDSEGNTLLHAAAALGDARLVALLLSGGADARAANAAGCTPLACARLRGHDTVVTLLEKACAK